MDVFIIWSEERSRIIAEALREWMPQVINAIKPWVSSQDIDPGARWSPKLANRLDKTGFGIICLTPENPDKPWILFEAGAISKIVDKSNVVPYLYELKPSDLQGPLSQFHAIQANEDDTRKLMTSINKTLAAADGGALGDEAMTKAFNKWWPELEQNLDDVPDSPTPKKPERPQREMLEEILGLVREQARDRISVTSTDPTGRPVHWVKKADVDVLRAYMRDRDVLRALIDDTTDPEQLSDFQMKLDLTEQRIFKLEKNISSRESRDWLAGYSSS